MAALISSLLAHSPKFSVICKYETVLYHVLEVTNKYVKQDRSQNRPLYYCIQVRLGREQHYLDEAPRPDDPNVLVGFFLFGWFFKMHLVNHPFLT